MTTSLPGSRCPALSLAPLGGQPRVRRWASVSRISDKAQPQTPGFPSPPPRPCLEPRERPSTHYQKLRLSARPAQMPGRALGCTAPGRRVRGLLSAGVRNRKWRLLKGAGIVYAQKASYVPLWNYASPKPRLRLSFGWRHEVRSPLASWLPLGFLGGLVFSFVTYSHSWLKLVTRNRGLKTEN